MSDKEKILNLQRLYATHFDARDAEKFADLFAPDGVMVPPGLDSRALVGREILIKVVNMTPPGGEHRPGKSEIKIDGDTATAVSRYEFTGADGSLDAGTYEDEFARFGDGWKFTRRAVKRDT